MIARQSGYAALVFLVVIAMATAPIAAATSGTGASAAFDDDVGPDDLEVTSDEISTGSGADVASELRESASSGDTVQVMVELDAAESTFFEKSTDGARVTSDSRAALEYEASISQAPLSAFADRSAGVEIVTEFWITNAVLLEVDTTRTDLDGLARVDGVTALRPNYEVELAEPESSVSVDEYDAEHTYGLEQVNAPDVWETFDARGEGASVAVLDTGIDADHPEFADFDAENNYQHFDASGLPTDAEPMDTNGHGTHVSGTVLGGDESGTRIGVAPEAELYVGAVIPGGSGSIAQIIAGIQWAVEEDVDVVNLSLGSRTILANFIDVVRNAEAAGTLFVSSSGNTGPGTTGSPAVVYDAMSVGATDESGAITGFSSGNVYDTAEVWGYVAPDDWPADYTTPSVSAPGNAVLSAEPGGAYAERPGTSMAAPHVTGVAALVSTLDESLGPADIREVLEATATKPHPEEISESVVRDAATVADDQVDNLFDDDVRDVRYGYGIVDAYAAAVSLADESATVEGTVVNDGTPAEAAVVEVDHPGIRSVRTDGSGAFSVDVPAGEYEFTVDRYGEFASESTTVDAGETATVALEIEEALDIANPAEQPREVASNDSFELPVEAANVDELTVELGDDSTISAANVTVELAGEELALGEATVVGAAEGSYTGELPLTVGTDAGEGERIELVLSFTGPGEDVTGVSAGTTSVLFEGAQRSTPELVEFDAAGGIDPFTPSLAGTATVHNPGDFVEDVTIYHELEGVEPFEWNVTLGAGETTDVEIGPYNWIALSGPGPAVDHVVHVGDDTSEPATLTFEGTQGLQGYVTDPGTDEGVKGATVTVTLPDGTERTDVTNGNGYYGFAPETWEAPPGEYTVRAEHGGYVTATETFDVPEDEGLLVDFDVELPSDPTYEFTMEAGEVYSLGIPGPVAGGTVGDVIDADTAGQVYRYRADAGEWVGATADTPVAPLDALVVTPDEETTVTIELAGEPGDTGSAVPVDREIVEGWNYLAPASHDSPDEAFVTTAEELRVLAVDAHEQAPSKMVATGDFAGSQLVGSAEGNVSPFSGYFLFVDEDGYHSSALTEGETLAGANDKMNLPTETFTGNVVGLNGENPVPGATISIDGTPFETRSLVPTDYFTENDGSFEFEHLAPADEFPITADAPGLEPVSGAAPNEIVIPLQEERFLEIQGVEVNETTLEHGDAFEVTYAVENVGVEPATHSADLEMIGSGSYVLDSRMLSLDPGESTQVTVTKSIDDDHVAGEYEIGLITNAIGDPVFQDLETVEVDVVASNFDLVIDEAESDTVATEGEDVNVTATVGNFGNGEDTQSISLIHENGTVLDSDEVTIPPGGEDTAVTVELTWETVEGDAADDVALTVASEDAEATHVVTIEEAGEPEPSITLAGVPA